MEEDILRHVDDTIHAKARLGIMAILVVDGDTTFPKLKERLGLSDGNLGSHIRVLEEAGHLTVHKAFSGRKPKTTCRATEKGRRAYFEYIDALERLIEASRKGRG